jgi:hypothetical protein
MSQVRAFNHDILIGPYGASSLKSAADFHAAGANAAWFHGFDEASFSACDAFGLAACVEFPTFRADFARRPELVPIGIDGLPIRHGELVQGVCLSNLDFLAEIEANLRQGIRQFNPRGIWFDYLAYAGWFETPRPDLQDNCFCQSCMKDFCQTTGIDADTPMQIVSEHGDAWQTYKRRKIAGYSRHYANLVREIHPDCIIGIYMCPWQPYEFDAALGRIFGQDYQLLAESVDVFTPLIYVHKSGREPTWGKAYLEASDHFVPPGKKVQLILDYLDFPDSLEATARSGVASWGFQMYGGGEVFDHPKQIDIFRRSAEQIRRMWQDNRAIRPV